MHTNAALSWLVHKHSFKHSYILYATAPRSILWGKFWFYPKNVPDKITHHSIETPWRKVSFFWWIFPFPSTFLLQIDLFLWRRIVRRKQNGSIHHSACPRLCAINNTLLLVSECTRRNPAQFKAITTNKQNGTAEHIWNNSCYCSSVYFLCFTPLRLTLGRHWADIFIRHDYPEQEET